MSALVRALARFVPFALVTLPPLLAQAERPPEQFQVAVGLQQRGLHDEAAQHFADFVKQQPQHALAAEASYRLGLSRTELKQNDAAITALRAALQSAGPSFRLRPECRYRLGNLLEAKKDHKAAIEQFEALAKEIGNDHYLSAAARYAAGETQRELGDDEKAAASFKSAADVATGERASYRFPALYQLGFAHVRRGQFAPGAAAFTAAAGAGADGGQQCECWYLAGDALLRSGDHDGADQAFAKAQKLGGEFADDAAYGRGWVCLGRSDRAAAVRAFTALVDAFPRSPLVPQARLEAGRALYQDQQAAAAVQQLEPLLQDGVPDAVRQQARELLGLCAMATGAGEAAVASLQQALAAAPPADKPRLCFALGEALANLGKWEEALRAYESMPKDAPPELRGDASYGACFALHSLGRHQESSQRAEAVIALQPPHRLVPEARLALAENCFALQQYEAAEKAYGSLGDAAPHRSTAQWKIAWCRYLRGDKAEASKRFAAIAADAASPNAEEALAMQALAELEAGQGDAALASADRYRARHRDGAFLERTERVASRVLRQKGDLTGAQQRLERAAVVSRQRGGDAAAGEDVAEQAELAYEQGDFRAADTKFAQLTGRKDAVGARALAGRAWCAFELGDDDACTKSLGAAKAHAAAAGELPGLLELESALQHRQQQWPAAVKTAQSFLAQFAQHKKAPAMRYALGVAQARAGDQDAARKTLDALLKAGGHDRPDRVAYELAWACRRGGDEKQALAAFEEVAKRSADDELAGEARLHLGVAALERKDLAAARPWLEAVQGTHRSRALYRLAFAEFEAATAAGAQPDKQQLAAARDRFVAVTNAPGELAGESRYLAAECCQRLGDPRGAAGHCKALVDKEPQHARADRARLLLGECALQLNEPDVAVPALEQFLRGKITEKAADKSDLARANLWLGRARMLRKEHDAAEACLTKVTELSDGALAAEAQFRIGENREQKGDLRGAADAFVKLPILYAQPEWVRAGLLQAARVYEQLQQPDKAQRFYRELVENHAGSAEAKVAEQRTRER